MFNKKKAGGIDSMLVMIMMSVFWRRNSKGLADPESFSNSSSLSPAYVSLSFDTVYFGLQEMLSRPWNDFFRLRLSAQVEE